MGTVTLNNGTKVSPEKLRITMGLVNTLERTNKQGLMLLCLSALNRSSDCIPPSIKNVCNEYGINVLDDTVRNIVRSAVFTNRCTTSVIAPSGLPVLRSIKLDSLYNRVDLKSPCGANASEKTIQLTLPRLQTLLEKKPESFKQLVELIQSKPRESYFGSSALGEGLKQDLKEVGLGDEVIACYDATVLVIRNYVQESNGLYLITDVPKNNSKVTLRDGTVIPKDKYDAIKDSLSHLKQFHSFAYRVLFLAVLTNQCSSIEVNAAIMASNSICLPMMIGVDPFEFAALSYNKKLDAYLESTCNTLTQAGIFKASDLSPGNIFSSKVHRQIVCELMQDEKLTS